MTNGLLSFEKVKHHSMGFGQLTIIWGEFQSPQLTEIHIPTHNLDAALRHW